MKPEAPSPCSACSVYPATLFGRIGVSAEVPESLRHGHRVARRNAVIQQADRAPRELYTILCGWCARSVSLPDGRRLILDFFLPGDFLTLPALLDEPAHGQIKAITAVSLCAFSPAVVIDWIKRNGYLERIVRQIWHRQYLACEKRLVDIGLKSADERLAALIVQIREKCGMTGSSGEVMNFPLRLTHIAEATGITPVHASRTMKALEKAGLIRRESKGLRILDAQGLHDLAAGGGSG